MVYPNVTTIAIEAVEDIVKLKKKLADAEKVIERQRREIEALREEYGGELHNGIMRSVQFGKGPLEEMLDRGMFTLRAKAEAGRLCYEALLEIDKCCKLGSCSEPCPGVAAIKAWEEIK